MIALSLIALVYFPFLKNKNDLCLPLLLSNDRVIGVWGYNTAKMLEAGSLLAGKDGKWVSRPCVAHCLQNCLRHVFNDCKLILEPLAQSKVVNHFHLLKNQVDGSKQPIEHNYSGCVDALEQQLLCVEVPARAESANNGCCN